MVLFLHNRYRTVGGEERVVDDLRWLVREHLGEDAELLERDSALLGRGRAATGLLRGGLEPEEIAAAVRRTRARVVHAHNLSPAFGWRALAAARAAGARVVVHLHNYRLVCAVATCFTHGEDCTRCHGRDTLPGVRLRCRGSTGEAVVYGAALTLWQRRLAAQVDRFVVPSAFALRRLGELGAPVDASAAIVPHPVRAIAAGPVLDPDGPALVAARLSVEKGVDVAIEACRRARVPLVVAGDGPERPRLEALAAGADVTFLGAVAPERVAVLRARASIALLPSRSAEVLPVAAAEALAAGLPVVGSAVGGMGELLEPAALVAPGDPDALAGALRARRGDATAAQRGLERVRALARPERVAGLLAAVYAGEG